jgi:hypothetical protein
LPREMRFLVLRVRTLIPESPFWPSRMRILIHQGPSACDGILRPVKGRQCERKSGAVSRIIAVEIRMPIAMRRDTRSCVAGYVRTRASRSCGGTVHSPGHSTYVLSSAVHEHLAAPADGADDLREGAHARGCAVELPAAMVRHDDGVGAFIVSTTRTRWPPMLVWTGRPSKSSRTSRTIPMTSTPHSHPPVVERLARTLPE